VCPPAPPTFADHRDGSRSRIANSWLISAGVQKRLGIRNTFGGRRRSSRAKQVVVG